MGRTGLARRLVRLEAARVVPVPRVNLSRLTDAELDYLAELGERCQTPSGAWDVAAMTLDERLTVDAILARVESTP